MDINWDDEDAPERKVTFDEPDEDIFEFESSLRIVDDTPVPDDLPPLASGVRDVLGDRGVLIERSETRSRASSAASATGYPCKQEPIVELHYEGFVVSTGEKFDSSREQGYTAVFQLDIPPSGKSTLIWGLEIALPELRAGDVAKITVASRYAYGAEGSPPDIPPDSDLRFDVEIIDVRATRKRVTKVDHSAEDKTRLEAIRRDRAEAKLRKDEKAKEDALRKEAKAEALRKKLLEKENNKKGKGKKGKKGKNSKKPGVTAESKVDG